MKKFRIKSINLKFKDVYNSMRCLVLEINTSNASCNINVNYNFLEERDEEIRNIYLHPKSNINILNDQQQLLCDTISQLLIDGKKESLNELNGMICLLLNNNGERATVGEKVVSVKILPQQLITLNGKSYYELNTTVDKMLND